MNKEFKCQRCGECCGIVPFSKDEYKKVMRIAKKMNVSFTKDTLGTKIAYFPKKSYKAYCKIRGKGIITDPNFDNHEAGLTCPFLEYDKDGKSLCNIYDLRPQLCRDFGNGTHQFLTCSKNKYMYFNRNE